MALTAGSILDGTVINITNFGAFVEVEGKTGLVHISEISDTYVKDIREYLKEKDKVRVKVISIDDNGKISLSIKQASISQKPIDIDWSVDNSNKHGGPFANIAHGCNSILATKMALSLGDFVVTEAGFGADLGAEKFFDIKCRYGNLKPACTVLVATIRALKHHGGAAKDKLNEENLEALKAGIENLGKQIENIKSFNVPVVVSINAFVSDTDKEIEFIENYCHSKGVDVQLTKVWEKGGEGGINLANSVIKTIEEGKSKFQPIYDINLPIMDKMNIIAKTIYGADGVEWSLASLKQIKEIETLGHDKLPICVAKTQYSLSDNPALLGRPSGFKINVKEVRLSNGAGFIIALTGDIMTMPGLPKVPAAVKMDINEDGSIIGLF